MRKRPATVIWNGRPIDLSAPRARRRGSGSWGWRRIGVFSLALVIVATVGAVALPPALGCGIKGNVSDSGERIYHLPGQHYYLKTRVSYLRGERWFCSEGAARTAGWRPALR